MNTQNDNIRPAPAIAPAMLNALSEFQPSLTNIVPSANPIVAAQASATNATSMIVRRGRPSSSKGCMPSSHPVAKNQMRPARGAATSKAKGAAAFFMLNLGDKRNSGTANSFPLEQAPHTISEGLGLD
jgi:hypothetical protein